MIFRTLNRLNRKFYLLNPVNFNRKINLSFCMNSNSTEQDPFKRYSLLTQKIRNQLEESNKLDDKAKSLLAKLGTICDEIKELDEFNSNENELKNLIEDDLLNLSKKYEKLKTDLIELQCRESYLTDELTMEFENGVGGNEAMIFTKELVNFYSQFCRKQNWTIEQVDCALSGDVDGFLYCTLKVTGNDCFKLLRHEAGVHRVQRIPTTDKMNRVHTSTIAIKIVPIFEASEIDLSLKNLQIETMRSTGPGGQNVNKRESAIRILHLPTNIAVRCDEHRIQEDNRKTAMDKLRFKLSEIKYKEMQEQEAKIRSNQVKSVMRSEKIRTFNFPQDRITDHRIKKSMSNIKGFFSGNCNQNLVDWLNELNDDHNFKLKEEFVKKLDFY